jgi:hypothetical protein
MLKQVSILIAQTAVMWEKSKGERKARRNLKKIELGLIKLQNLVRG